MGICKSKISSTSSFENIITKKTSKNENNIITKTNSNQKIYLTIVLKINPEFPQSKNNYYMNLSFDNIDDCHTYLFQQYASSKYFTHYYLVALRAFNNERKEHQDVILNGDSSGFECYITKKSFESQDIITKYKLPQNKNFESNVYEINNETEEEKIQTLQDYDKLMDSEETKTLNCNNLLESNGMYDETVPKWVRKQTDKFFKHFKMESDNYKQATPFQKNASNIVESAKSPTINKQFKIQDSITTYKPKQDKKFQINGNEIQCKINNEFVFSITRPYTNNNFEFVGESQSMFLNCSKQAAKDGIVYEDYTLIQKLDENKYLFNSNFFNPNGKEYDNDFKFYLNKQELEEFKSMCWKSEAEMLAYYDLK